LAFFSTDFQRNISGSIALRLVEVRRKASIEK